MHIAGIEAGGTSIKVAIADDSDLTKIINQTRIPTTTPDETLGKITEWLDGQKFGAIGVACFGPVDLHTDSPTYGYITTTPKPGWQNIDVLGPLKKYDVPLGFDTDVNGAALGELVWGSHGVGVVVDGKAVHGLLHPEGGHIPCPRDELETLDRGVCPYHGNCVEGYVCTGAIAARVDKPASELALVPDDHVVWTLTGHYLAHLCAVITLLCSPQVIVIGGGVVVNRVKILPIVREHTPTVINGYLQSTALDDMVTFIKPSKHGDNAGLIGALEMGRQVVHSIL